VYLVALRTRYDSSGGVCRH